MFVLCFVSISVLSQKNVCVCGGDINTRFVCNKKVQTKQKIKKKTYNQKTKQRTKNANLFQKKSAWTDFWTHCETKLYPFVCLCVYVCVCVCVLFVYVLVLTCCSKKTRKKKITKLGVFLFLTLALKQSKFTNLWADKLIYYLFDCFFVCMRCFV